MHFSDLSYYYKLLYESNHYIFSSINEWQFLITNEILLQNAH